MFVKIGALSFLVLILFGSVMASPVCPWEPLKPSELGFTSITGQLSNGGTVNGVLFMGSSTLSGEVGNTTGYVSTSKDVLGKAQEITYAGTESLGYTSETAFIVSSGSLNFKESGMLSYSSTENPMYCEDAYTNVEVHLSDGQFASTMNVQSPVSLINHNSAVEGTGSFSGQSAYSLLEGSNRTISSYTKLQDHVLAIGEINFGREVLYKSVKS